MTQRYAQHAKTRWQCGRLPITRLVNVMRKPAEASSKRSKEEGLRASPQAESDGRGAKNTCERTGATEGP